jgi:hypothetical protein
MPAACAAVREHLPEYAVGVLPERARLELERHLEWCAACRKEAGELSGAAASLAFALPPGELPDGLLSRVLAQIARAVRTPASRRRTRAAASVAIAAMVALSALGWGAVMAGRAERFQVLARAEADRQVEALRQVQKVFQTFQGELGTGLRADETRLARLAPTTIGGGGGAALQFVSPSMLDFVMVHLSGLRADGALPYRVWLIDGEGRALRAGRLTALDANGGGEVFHQFDIDLTPYTTVLVRDAKGDVALRGVVDGGPQA